MAAFEAAERGAGSIPLAQFPQRPSARQRPSKPGSGTDHCLLHLARAKRPASRSGSPIRSAAWSHLHLLPAAGAPNPAGAETSVSLRPARTPASSRPIRRGRGARCGRSGGTYSLVLNGSVTTNTLSFPNRWPAPPGLRRYSLGFNRGVDLILRPAIPACEADDTRTPVA